MYSVKKIDLEKSKLHMCEQIEKDCRDQSIKVGYKAAVPPIQLINDVPLLESRDNSGLDPVVVTNEGVARCYVISNKNITGTCN
jgi:hypothetical protein